MDKIQAMAKNIRLVIFDVDGVLTDGSLFFDNNGEEYKAFNSKDGHGIRMLLESDIQVAIITGRQSEIVKHRANNLQIDPEYVYQGYRDKRPAFKELLTKTKLSVEQIAYVGDDVIDLPIMSQVGVAIAVNDAHEFVQKHADWVTQLPGGKGAVREVSEMILESQGKLESLLHSYLDN